MDNNVTLVRGKHGSAVFKDKDGNTLATLVVSKPKTTLFTSSEYKDGLVKLYYEDMAGEQVTYEKDIKLDRENPQTYIIDFEK